MLLLACNRSDRRGIGVGNRSGGVVRRRRQGHGSGSERMSGGVMEEHMVIAHDRAVAHPALARSRMQWWLLNEMRRLTKL